MLPPPGSRGFISSITAMEAFAHLSLIELRLQDGNVPATWSDTMWSRMHPKSLTLAELCVRASVGSIVHDGSEILRERLVQWSA